MLLNTKLNMKSVYFKFNDKGSVGQTASMKFYSNCRTSNIVFQHPIALMYHLYTFTSISNATLFTITPLLKNTN
jgi:hypothetical protein